jgi:predicted MPP superfamily phosphohydrolase
MRGFGGKPRVARYDVRSTLWRAPSLRIALLSDLHICDPWSPLEALDQVVDEVMEEAPDVICLAGDFLGRGVLGGRYVPADAIAGGLQRLRAPKGVFASLGNHDWKDCPEARANGFTQTSVTAAMEDVGIPVLSNRAVDLGGGTFVVGIDSQQGTGRAREPDARHDPVAAFADVPGDASIVLMAHEPDYFLDAQVRDVALQLSGHTHAGQITLGGWRPATPSRYGGRLAHGLHSEGERRLIVSAGLGYTTLPLRIGAPPDWAMVTLSSG